MSVKPVPLPAVRTISPMRPLVWLVYAWRDMARVDGSALRSVLAILGAAIVATAHQRFWLLAGALSGFMVMPRAGHQCRPEPRTGRG
jgi:hypothetical protein